MGWFSSTGYGWGVPGVVGINDPCYMCLWNSAYNNTNVALSFLASANSETEINLPVAESTDVSSSDAPAHAWGVRCVAE